jgi:uncharacterized protein (TIGR02145 family)
MTKSSVIKNLSLNFLLIALMWSCTDPNGLLPIKGRGSVVDYDGNTYDTLRIGTQTWLAQNLRVTHYRNGDVIPMLADQNQWLGANEGAWCNYNNSSTNSKDNGRLYNYNVIADQRDIAPEGWHVATNKDWYTLQKYLIKNGYGVNQDTTTNKIAICLASNTGWYSFSGVGYVGNNLTQNNKTKFGAIPVGARDINGNFTSEGSISDFWMSLAEVDSLYRNCVYLKYDRDSLTFTTYGSQTGLSIRCVKD